MFFSTSEHMIEVLTSVGVGTSTSQAASKDQVRRRSCHSGQTEVYRTVPNGFRMAEAGQRLAVCWWKPFYLRRGLGKMPQSILRGNLECTDKKPA
jgi:hypothetical protein